MFHSSEKCRLLVSALGIGKDTRKQASAFEPEFRTVSDTIQSAGMPAARVMELADPFNIPKAVKALIDISKALYRAGNYPGSVVVAPAANGHPAYNKTMKMKDPVTPAQMARFKALTSKSR